MRRAILTYGLIGVSVVLAAISAAMGGRTGEPWLSIVSLSLLIAAGIRVSVIKGAVELALSHAAVTHLKLQRACLLLFVVTGVLSAFQWLLMFSQPQLSALIQALAALLYLTAVAVLVFGVGRVALQLRPVAPPLQPEPVAATDAGAVQARDTD